MTVDEQWMELALTLARHGEGRTRPNPPVGAVVVRNGKPAGSGFHREAGGPHAEVIALKAAGESAKGADLYVTLEPCSTQGKTPPCTDAIVAAGIARTVFAVRDPNPIHRGRGARLLRRAGVAVKSGVCAAEASDLIAPFAKWIDSGRPFVSLKMGMTLDGRISDESGSSRWITSAAARAKVHDLRSRADAVLVGSGTARRDDPSLLCHGRRKNSHLRVIVDSRGALSPRARVFEDGRADTTVIATTKSCPAERRRAYESAGAQVWVLSGSRGRVSLKAMLGRLGKLGMLHVLCEGGGRLACELARAGLVDRYLFFVAPKLLAGIKSTSVLSGAGWKLGHEPRLEFTECRRVGEDVMLIAKPQKEIRAKD